MPGVTGQVLEVRLLDRLRERLVETYSQGKQVRGALYGVELEQGVKCVVAAAGQEVGLEKMELELVNEMLPCGIEPMGVFGVSGGEVGDLVPLAHQLPPLTQPTETPLLLMVGEGGEVQCRMLDSDQVLTVSPLTEEELWDQLTLVRVKGDLVLNSGMSEGEVSAAFRHMIEKASCPYGSFVLEGGRLVFLHKFLAKEPGRGWTRSQEEEEKEDEEDCLVVGLEGEEGTTVEQLWQYTVLEQEEDDWGTGKVNKKTKVEPRDRLELSLVWNYSSPACSSRTIGCAPLVHREEKSGPTLRLPLSIDCLGVISNKANATGLMEVLKGAVGRQVGDMAAAVLSELKMKSTVSTPEVFHFRPPGLGHHLSLVYTKAAETKTFETFRRTVHSRFLLPLNRPMFRRANAVQWSQPGAALRLSNVHRGLELKHGVGEGAQVALVQGNYQYHHYMQDSFDDDGWGCAYRSLQTIVSWLGLQGYTDTSVPSHRDIQKVLVDIGDKETKFIGSKQWIGSTEVGFVLETSCGIQSRFVSVSAGSDMGSKARELVLHFQTQGSPVMVGGGVYAHTILGVAWDEVSGDCAWLILDPHYTGSEDLKTIISKGWCGWKKPSFWNQTAFYNMCLPQIPKDVV